VDSMMCVSPQEKGAAWSWDGHLLRSRAPPRRGRAKQNNPVIGENGQLCLETPTTAGCCGGMA